MDKDDLEILIELGMSQRDIAAKLEKSQATVRYWLKKHGICTKDRRRFWDEVKFAELCESENSVHMVLVGMGVSSASGNYKFAHRLANKLGIELPKFKGSSPRKRKYSLEELFSNGTKRDNQKLRRLMVSEYGIPDECVECGLGPVWRSKEITLQLDHIDGDNKNNTLENLRIMCPNCHSQTDTFCRRK